MFACLQDVTNSLRLFKVASSGLKNDEIFLPQTQITAVRDRAKGSGLFQNFPGDPELQFCRLQVPNVFTEFCTQSLAGVIERRFVVGKSRFNV